MAVWRVPGPCTIKFDNNTLGSSKTGIVIRTRTSWAPVIADAYGTEPADFIFTGKAVQVEAAGLDVSALKAANIWGLYGGLLMSTTNCLLAIGALASALGKQLDIVEREGSFTWTALLSVPLDPDAMALVATTELTLPMTFLIVPDGNGKLFSVLPSYLLA